MGKEVDEKITYVSESEMAQTIKKAWEELYRENPQAMVTPSPTQEQIAMILAQNALETGHRKNMYDYNVGNLVAGDTNYNYYFLGKNPRKFRSYSSLLEGTKDYLKLLSQDDRYTKAWKHMLNPDPSKYSKSLKEGGYYTEGEAGYTEIITSLYNKFKNDPNIKQKLKSELKSKTDLPDDSLQKLLSGLLTTNAPSSEQQIMNFLKEFESTTPANDSSNQLQLAASYKKIYQKLLPNHTFLLKIGAKNSINAIEFSRILSTALDEELLSDSSVYTNGQDVDIECKIAGPALACAGAVQQIASIVSEQFNKISADQIYINVHLNEQSEFPEISLQAQETNHRKFLLKKAQGHYYGR